MSDHVKVSVYRLEVVVDWEPPVAGHVADASGEALVRFLAFDKGSWTTGEGQLQVTLVEQVDGT